MLEPRLYPLLETLTRADLDWLAQEIVSGALAGKVAEESPETLRAARSMVSRRTQDSGVRLPVRPSDEPAEALSADDQIEWAAQHVVERLERMLEMFRHSIDRLEELANGEDAEKSLREAGAGIVLVLGDDQAISKVDRAQLGAAIERLDELRDALGTWAAEARRGEQT